MRETQEAFERLLRAAETGETPPPATGPAEQEAAELVALAERLHRMQYLQVSPSARQRILVKALNTPFEPRRGRILQFPARPPEWTRTAARIAASVAAIAVLGGTVSVSASAASLPDSPLYPVKLLVEDVRVAVALPEQKPKLYAEQAAQRLQETEAMIDSGNIPAAERSADVANQRLAAARTAVDGAAQPEARNAIDKATDQAVAVNKRLEQQGGTAPKPAIVASLVSPTPRPTPLPLEATPAPLEAATTPPSDASPTALEPASGVAADITAAVGAPARGFTPIAGSDVSPASNAAVVQPVPTATPAEARVVAPAPSAFVQIVVGGSPTPRPTAAVAGVAPVQTFVQIDPPPPALRVSPTPVPSLTATATATLVPTAVPTTSPSPTRTAEPRPTSAAPSATPVPTRS